MPENLAALTDEALVSLFRERGTERAILEALNEELRGRDTDEAIELHLKVAAARRGLQSAVAAPAAPMRTGPVRDWVRQFLLQRRLSVPDGRPIYRYRMADAEFDEAKGVLKVLARTGRLDDPDARAGALFVAFCAEWFRRESRSTFLKWDEIDPGLFPSVPYASKQKLTESGLKFWRRDLRRSAHAREFLLTLALEGGIPVQVFVDGARSWLRDYLRAILRRATAERVSSDDQLLDIAREERWRMRRSYDHDDFVAVCSELAMAILRLRQQAEANGVGGIANSAILDATQPGWREELPIHVPAEDEALARELLTGLLDEKLAGLLTRGVDARRYLVQHDGVWTPALQLLADGEIPAGRLPWLSAQGRFRAVPVGQLAEHVSGEVALLEPPADGQKSWRMRPLMRASRLIRDFPLEAPVVVTLSSPSAQPASWTWPSGEGKHSDILVFQEEDDASSGDRLLRLVRAGSASLPAQVLHVLMPDDWKVDLATEGAVVSDVPIGTLGRRLVEVRGIAYFHVTDEMARYRVATDSQARTTELQIQLVNLGCRPAEPDWDLVPSSVALSIRDDDKIRPPRAKEVFYRRPNDRWRELVGPLEGAGPYELSLRDPVADIQIDKRRIALVPKEARIEVGMTAPLCGELRLNGLEGWTVAAPQLTPTGDPELFRIDFAGRPNYQLRVTLLPPGGLPFDVVVSIAGRDAVVALRDGAILTAGSTADMSALRGALIVAPSRTVVELAPKGARAGGVSTIVDGELPLGVLRSAMQESLASLADQDGLLELAFLGDTRPPIRICRFREQLLPFQDESIRWTQPLAAPSTLPVVRMVLDPRHEHALEPKGAGLWAIPDRCYGPCLVYLRDGVDVVSRPRLVPETASPPLSLNPLQAALMIPAYAQRQGAILDVLHSVANGSGSAETLAWLIEAAVNLRGLPASTIDALRLLPSCPEAAVALLLNAREADRATIWSLQDELPLLWLALPVSTWQRALGGQYTTLSSALEAAFDQQAAAAMAMGQINTLREQLIALEPALGAICGTPAQRVKMAAALPPLNLLASSYVGSQHDRNREDRNQHGDRLLALGLKLPVEIASKSHTMFAGLFAPVLLAASAAGKLTLEREDALLIRRVLREDPVYVASAWAHLLDFYGAFAE